MPLPAVGRAGRRPALRAVACAVLLAATIAALSAWAVLNPRGGPLASPGEQVVAVGGTSVTVPPDWRPAGGPGRVVPGLAEPTAVLDPFPGLSIHAVVALSPHGVPRALKALMGPLGTGRRAQLAGLPALAYDERPVAGDRVAEVTVARSPSGALIVACIGRAESWSLAAGCAEQVGLTRTAR
jgi:hypothetical protein